jgi:hypothetical protein
MPMPRGSGTNEHNLTVSGDAIFERPQGLYEVPVTDETVYRRFAMAIRRSSRPVGTTEATWEVADQPLEHEYLEESQPV